MCSRVGLWRLGGGLCRVEVWAHPVWHILPADKAEAHAPRERWWEWGSAASREELGTPCNLCGTWKHAMHQGKAAEGGKPKT